MDVSRHRVVLATRVSLHDYERLLCSLGQAAMDVDSPEPFALECVLGYPFAWILHPGLEAGAIVVAYEHLLFLEQLGYISLRVEDCALTGTLSLTPAGFARCAELEVFQA